MVSQTQRERGRKRRERIYETIVSLTAQGETDAAGGGVPMARLTDDLDSTRGAIERHLTTLREQGRIEQVYGRGRASPDGPVVVRASYRPTDDGLRADGGHPPAGVVHALAAETPVSASSIDAAARAVDGVARDLEALANGTSAADIDLDRPVAAVELHALDEDAAILYEDADFDRGGRDE